MRSLTWETRVGLKSHHLWANFSAVRTGKSQFARGTDSLHWSASHRHHSWCTHMFGQVRAFGVHVVPASEQAEGKQQSHFGNTGHWRVILTGNVQSSCVRWQRLLELNEDQKRSASLCPVAKQRRRLIKSFFFIFFFTARLVMSAVPWSDLHVNRRRWMWAKWQRAWWSKIEHPMKGRVLQIKCKIRRK